MRSKSEREIDTGISLASEVVMAEHYRKPCHFAQSNHSQYITDIIRKYGEPLDERKTAMEAAATT